MNDPRMTFATTGFGVPGVTRPNAFIQWKGTDVCLDFHCDCGFNGHYDGWFAYGLHCASCGKVWAMPHTVGLIADPDAEDGPAVQSTDWPHSDTDRPKDAPRVVTVQDE
jgi:hypothetical protein